MQKSQFCFYENQADGFFFLKTWYARSRQDVCVCVGEGLKKSGGFCIQVISRVSTGFPSTLKKASWKL